MPYINIFTKVDRYYHWRRTEVRNTFLFRLWEEKLFNGSMYIFLLSEYLA